MKTDSTAALEFKKQPRLILAAFRLLVVNTKFLSEYRPLLDPAHWGEMELKWIVAQCIDHYDRSKKAPRMQVMRALLDADESVDADMHVLVTRVLDKLDDMEVDGEMQDFVDSEFEAFIRYRAVRAALAIAQEYTDEAELDRAAEVVAQSQLVRRVKDDFKWLPRTFEEFYDNFNAEQLARITVPIGIPALDKKLGGGGRKGELLVWVAPLGYGKSMALVHVGAAAYRLGKSILHFTFENSVEETHARYCYNLLATDSDVLPKWGKADDRFLDRLAQAEEFNGSLGIMALIGSRTTPADLGHIIARRIEQGDPPDLVIVDYADFLRSSRPSTNKASLYEEMKAVYEELREVAVEHKVVLWTATQANREGLKSKRVRTEHVADSLSKAMVADVLISISKETKDKGGRRITPEVDYGEDDGDAEVLENENRILHLVKLRRGGSDDWWLPVKAHYSQAKFEQDDWEGPSDEAVAVALEKKQAQKSVRSDDE